MTKQHEEVDILVVDFKEMTDERGKAILEKAFEEVGIKDRVRITYLMKDTKDIEEALPTLVHEVFDCRPFVIVTLGTDAFKAIRNKKVKITKVRGTLIPQFVYDEDNKKRHQFMLIPTIHPEYIIKRGKPEELILDLQDDFYSALEIANDSVRKNIIDGEEVNE